MIPPIARRFVAGESEAAALERARQLDERSVGAILNLLGEHYEERQPADEDTAAYCRLGADIARTALRACISVKPSQLGLDVSESLFRENQARVDRAADEDVFVWIDMENHTKTDATLDAFEAQTREHGGGVGVCVQATLKRTADDVDRLATLPGKVRLVKGAYDEPAENCDVWQYVPYGSRWLSYFYRRVAERRENLTFALRAIVN